MTPTSFTPDQVPHDKHAITVENNWLPWIVEKKLFHVWYSEQVARGEKVLPASLARKISDDLSTILIAYGPEPELDHDALMEVIIALWPTVVAYYRAHPEELDDEST